MNLNKVIKISSSQGGPFTKTSNLIDFDIPNDGVYNLSRSYVNLQCRIPSIGTDLALNGGVGMYMPYIQFNDDLGQPMATQVDNVSVIKNVSMTSSNRGVISDIRRVDVLRNNLKQYEKTTDSQKGDNYNLFSSSYMDSQQVGSIFRDTHKEGNVSSTEISAPIKIMIKDLLGFGNVTAYDTSRYGKSRLHLELNMDKIKVSQYLGSTSLDWSRGADRDKFVQATATVSSDLQTLLYTFPLRHLEESPFWVNQKLIFSLVGSASAPVITAQTRRIVSIKWRQGTIGANQAKLEITLNSPLGAAVTGADTYDITCVGDAAEMIFNCDYAELVLEKVMNPVNMSDQITYTEYSTEEYSCNNIQYFQRMFTCEPEAINLFIVKSDSVLSFNKPDDIQNYRFRVNNEDVTNRAVLYHSPLYFDQINRTFLNSNKQLKNTNERGNNNTEPRSSSLANYQEGNDSLILLCTPLPLTQKDKNVQVNIRTGTGTLANICLFKELVRSI